MLSLALNSAAVFVLLGQLGAQPLRVTQMSDAALAFAYPQQRSHLDFAAARFSPDGRFLALLLTDILTGDPEQLWLYEMRTGLLTPMTPPPRQRESLVIRDLAWSDGSVFISGVRIINSAGYPYLASATMAGLKTLDQLPAKVNEILQQPSKRLHVLCCQDQSDRYVVASEHVGHGAWGLSMQVKGQRTWSVIAQGGGELETFLFDPSRSQVLYPALGKMMAYDLQTRQSREVLTLNDPWTQPRLLDQTQDGTMVAYIEPGACLGPARGGDITRTDPPRHVCLLKLR